MLLFSLGGAFPAVQILPITVVENFALPDDAGAAQVDLCDMARDLRALIRGIVDVCRLIGCGDAARAARVIHNDVRVCARLQHALAGEETVELRGRFCQHIGHALGRDAACCDAVGEQQCAARLHAGHAAGNFREVAAPGVLLREGEAAVIR